MNEMKASVAILLLTSLPFLAGSGCVREKDRIKVPDARPTTATINANIGRGVLLAGSPTGSVFFLTARHVATYHELFRHDIDLAFECLDGKTVHRQLKDGERRWLTTAKPEIDLAWIELREDELPERGDFAFANIGSLSLKPLYASMSKEVLIASYQDRKASFSNFIFAEDVKFPGNQVLLCVTQEVGCLNAKINQSESGSPVFGASKDGNFTELIGIVTVGADSSDEGGFIPAVTVAEKMRHNLRGFSKTNLCVCTNLW